LATLLERGGVGVPVGDINSHVEVIDELLTDPNRRATLGETGRAYVTERHNWAETVRMTTERLAALDE
jgi:glycosyltransferase involved in cell wall biosynthesis